MRGWTMVVGIGVALCAGACGAESSPEAPPDDFVVPAGSVEIATGIFVASGSKSSEPFPAATGEPAAPIVTGGQWKNTGPHSFALGIEVQSAGALGEVHLELAGVHYVVTPSEVGGAIDVCGILQQQQGYGCSKACVDACACATCTEKLYEENVRGGCSVNCSILSREGGLADAPYDGSEVTYADVIYNGWVDDTGVEQVAGILDSFPACSGSVCAQAAAEEAAANAKYVWVDMYVQDWSFLDALDDIGCGVASFPVAAERPMMSNKGVAGTGTFTQAKACDPGACPH